MTKNRERFDYVKQLEIELLSMHKSSIGDLANATVEDMVRDIHKALYGNGNPNGSICMKVASANAQLGGVRKHIAELDEDLEEQTTKCAAVVCAITAGGAAKTDAAVERTMLHVAYQWVKPHTKTIIVIFVCGLIYLSNMYRPPVITDTVMKKLNDIIAEQTRLAIESNIDAIRTSANTNSGPAPRK